MSTYGTSILNREIYDDDKVHQALDMLYIDRKNEFRELYHTLLSKKARASVPAWKEYVLTFSLDVEDAFLVWSGDSSVTPISSQKTLTLLRQLGRELTSMNQLVHLLNMSYTLSLEFKEIYRRLK